MKMKKTVVFLLTIMVLLSFVACTSSPGPASVAGNTEEAMLPTDVPTEAPTEIITEAPAQTPTESPDVSIPEGYDVNNYTTLVNFFELADEKGIKNGDKLFPNYDPADPATWYDGSSNYYNYINWTDDEKVSWIALKPSGEGAEKLVGNLDLSGFDELNYFCLAGASIDGFAAKDLGIFGKGNTCKISVTSEGDAIISGGYVRGIRILSAKRVNCNITGEAESNLSVLPSSIIDITVDGEGYAGVMAYDDENYYVVKLVAESLEGKSFIGWFDQEGNLVSSEAEFELYGEQTGNSCIGAHAEFIFTARFE